MRLDLRLVLVTMALSIASGCTDEAQEDCADCPNPDLQPACLEAAEDCQGLEGMDDREACLEEARQLCE